MLIRLRALLASPPNRIALSSALRGTIATVTPLVALPPLGLGQAAEFAVIGALNASIVDVGGSYRNRLAAMAAIGLLGPLMLLCGMDVGGLWWAAALLMFVFAFSGGYLRALGPGSIPLGLNYAIAFLIGLQVPAATPRTQAALALAYAAGVAWTVLVTLAVWQLRPYRRAEQEVAGAWEAVTALVAEARPFAAAESTVALHRHERHFAKWHRASRDAIERARAVLGDLRADTHGPGTVMARLVVLLRAASRIDAATVALDEAGDASALQDEETRRALRAALKELEAACRAMTRVLLAGRGKVDFASARHSLARLTERAAQARARGDDGTANLLDAQIFALAQAVRHLDNAEEAARQIFASGRRLPLLRLPPLTGPGIDEAMTSLRAHLSPRSVVFRHALRVAVVAAIGTAVIVRGQVPHGFWLPMTALIILQPDYGGTLSRALQRTAGTVGGAIVAALLLVALRGTIAFQAAIAALLFLTFLLIRRRYGLAITFLTPLIILLLGLNSPNPWQDVEYRILDTLAGAVMAIVGGYLLWPLWERAHLPERLAQATRANRAYLAAVLTALTGESVPPQDLIDLRRDAEIESGNADAAFQRMMAEPRHQRGRIARGFMLDVYAQRITRHTVALAGYIGALRLPPPETGGLRQALEAALDEIATALTEGRAPRPQPDLDKPLERLRQHLAGDAAPHIVRGAALLLGQVVSDTVTMAAVAETRVEPLREDDDLPPPPDPPPALY